MKPENKAFSTSKPLEPGIIYQIQQGDVKRVVTKGSAERKGLRGHWVVLREFTNEVIDRNEKI